jgi:hypothetical protein
MHLNEDIVTNFNLRKLKAHSLELSRKYSILVRQQTLTAEAYNYWLNIQKGTEQLGSMFDPQPGQVIGNIRSIKNPDELVIGYFGAGAVTEKRIYIKPDDLPDHFADYLAPPCVIDTIFNEDLHKFNDPDQLISGVYDQTGIAIIGFTTAEETCIDCRDIAQGVNYKPWFWQD